MIRARRSVLYVPGSNARAMEKARTLPCDAVILDLEDAVAPEAKAQARQAVAGAIAQRGFGSREVIVRINSHDTPLWIEDLDAVIRARPDAILLPKVNSPDDITLVSDRLGDLGIDHAIRLFVMIETPIALLNIHALAASALDAENRLSCFVLGTNDIAKETRVPLMPGRAAMLPWLSTAVLAARAYGLDIVDGVYNAINDADGFAKECEQARLFGFDGKTLIHPSQLAPCNAAFSPTPAELEDARGLIACFDAPENRGRGAVRYKDRMVEKLHVDMARRTLALAAASQAG